MAGEHTKHIPTLVELQGGLCAYCGRALSLAPFNVDHMTPKWMGGGSHLENLAAVHETCNQEKGPLPLEEFLALREDKDALKMARQMLSAALSRDRFGPPWFERSKRREERPAVRAQYGETRATLADVWPK